MQYVLVTVVALAIAWFVVAPLRRPREVETGIDLDARLADLQLRKEGKYREIRDAQLDHAAGKLSDQDFEALDAELRREAMSILADLDWAEADARRAQT